MRRYGLVVGLLVVCGGLALLMHAQKRQAPPVRPGQADSAEQNKVAARRVFEELYTGGRFGEANQIFAPNCQVHFGNRTVPLQAAIAESRGWKSASPDSSMIVENISGNGDRVTVVWTARGTHTGQGVGVKPSGRRFSMRQQSEFVFQNGKIVEVFNNEYRTELFRQLGVSRPAAFMFFTSERVVALLADVLPDRLFSSLFLFQ